VIVGAQRAASTYLTARLSSHPQVFLCPDEVPFFEHPFFDASPVSALEAALAGASRRQRAGIRRPDYLGRTECAANIHSLVPEALMIAILRDPVARAISAYFWYMQFGLLPIEDLDVGFEKILDHSVGSNFPRASEIVDFGLYGRHLTRYVNTFGRERVLVLLDTEVSHGSALPEVFRFLGVSESHDPGAVGRPRNAGVYDLRRIRVLRSRNRFLPSWDRQSEYTYRPRRMRRPFAFVPNAAVVAFDRVLLAHLFRRPRPVLRPDLEERLRNLYSDDIPKVEALLGRELTSWRRSASG